MQLRNAELFCDVVACRSFSKAAELREMSQSAVSQSIQSLEEYLGAILIDRSKRPFDLTAAGEEYYSGCRRLLDSFRKLEDKIQGIGDRVAGRVRVASIYSVGLLQMNKYVEQFRDEFPDVALQLSYASSEDIYDQIHREEADIGIVSFPKDGGEFASIPWFDEELVLVVPPTHRLASQTSISWEDLNGESFVGFQPQQRIRRRIDRWLKDAHVSVTVVHTFDNIENIKRAVEIGVGVSILPSPTVRREVEHGFLKALRFVDTPVVRPLGIIHRRHKHLSAATEKFVDLLRSRTTENQQQETSGHEVEAHC